MLGIKFDQNIFKSQITINVAHFSNLVYEFANGFNYINQVKMPILLRNKFIELLMLYIIHSVCLTCVECHFEHEVIEAVVVVAISSFLYLII